MKPAARTAFLESLTDDEAVVLLYDWLFWARREQLAPPGNWRVWLILAGRGFGKTRAGAEFVIEKVRAGQWRRVALVGETAADVRDVMVEGESGIMAYSPPWFRPVYEPSRRRLTWPNGAIATTYSGKEPDQLRGPQHDGAWADEPAKWQYADEAWDNLEFGLRLGDNPQVVATTTPRPIKIIRDLLADPQTVVTRGSTYANRDNLAPGFLRRILRKYEGTRLGRQELHAELLEDAPGALWQRTEMIDKHRVASHPPLVRVVTAIDPSVSSEEDAAEAGIVAAGLGIDGHAYVLEDASRHGSPHQWAWAAVATHNKLKGDRIVGEVNNGGEMVELTIRTLRDEADRPIGLNIPYTAVHASRGKQARAEPISALYEQGRVHHVGQFAALEDELCSWVPGSGMPSPNHLDALVWCLTELMLGEPPSQQYVASYRR
jgi:phage terminase large subunit-like protein